MSESPTELTSGPFMASEAAVAQDSSIHAVEQTFLEDKLALALCDQYEKGKASIHDGDGWTGAVAEFIPFIDAYARDDDHEDLARGLLARLFEHSYRLNSLEGKSVEEFTFGVLGTLSKLRHVPDSLMRPRVQGNKEKRQPAFFETMMATLQRYKFMEGLPETFNGVADGIVVGGSMGYGPFFSVRSKTENGDSSDVDAIMVVDEEYGKQENWTNILASEQLQSAGVVKFLSRIEPFIDLQKDGKAEVISQRFEVPGQDFNMSAHFMSREVFEKMNGAELSHNLSTREDTIHVVKDYKPRKFEHPVCAQRSFDGSVYEYEVPSQHDAPAGCIAELPGYIISEEKYFPGIYQNLISPEFEVLHDATGFAKGVVEGFRAAVIEYVEAERAAGRTAHVSNSHIRSALFAPGRYSQRANLALDSAAQNAQ